MDSLFSPTALIEDITGFCTVADLTRLRFSQETLSGTWEALMDRRVDLLIGAAGEGPSGGGYSAYEIGTVKFVFAVSPEHPLANVEHPLGKSDFNQHLAISVSDSVRKMPPRTVGLLFGQNTLALPNMRSKYEFQLAGVGFGFLPEPIARQAIADGLLIERKVEEPRQPEPFYVAWRTEDNGAGLKWWIEKMKDTSLLNRLWTAVN
jgi:DNA-binding transcriptional LysR family regulator